jgi:hypothetical protein
MKFSNEEWILKFLNKIDKKILFWESFIQNGFEYLEKKYPYKNKKAYLNALKKCSIPKIFCVDIEKRKVFYLHNGIVKKCYNATSNPSFAIGKSRGVGSIIANLKALMNGKKQIAVSNVAKNRRMPDGSFKGCKKTHETKLKNGIYQRVVDGIAISRRMPDGSYKGSPPKTWTVEKVEKLLKDNRMNYKYLEKETKGNKEKVRFICDKNHLFKMKINAIQSFGYRCPACNESKGESLSREIIEKITGLNFLKSKPTWLKYPLTGRILELDGYNENLKIAFEYDGPQHSEPMYGLVNLKKCISRDLAKNKLCKKNKVHLIRISYKIKDIEKYIEKKLNKIWQK